jgi:phosphatidate cytidylyltransferase
MLKTRILTSLILIPSFVAALFLLPHRYWALLMLAVIAIAMWEWAVMIKLNPPVRVIYVLTSIAVGMALIFNAGATIHSGSQAFVVAWYMVMVAVAFWVVIAPIWLITRCRIKNLWAMAIVGWVVIFPTWLALSMLHIIGQKILLMTLIAVWIADSAAYFAGKRFGKRKLAPLISPGKTWEGVLGACLAVSAYGIFLCVFLNIGRHYYQFWIIVGLLGITVSSIMGDLLESLVKRQAGVKDSGNLLPGHGGILDRIDGLTASLPLALSIILPFWMIAQLPGN